MSGTLGLGGRLGYAGIAVHENHNAQAVRGVDQVLQLLSRAELTSKMEGPQEHPKPRVLTILNQS
eukprot:339942-Amphidinium_carterae.1